MARNILWFNEIGMDDVKNVGGKCASLGEMTKNMQNLGIKVPYGFAISTDAYDLFMKNNNLDQFIINELSQIKYEDHVNTARISQKIRKNIQNGSFPLVLETEILEAYKQLSAETIDYNGQKQTETDVAVRSSATCEDSSENSFAGQHETFLNVRGNASLLEKIKACFASLYNERAVDYRHNIKVSESSIKLAVAIQKMVRSDLGSAGVAFSLDTESGNTNVIVINSAFGLGELVVSGQVEPDEVMLFKPTLSQGKPAIIDKKMGNKLERLVYSDNQEKRVKLIPNKVEMLNKMSISNDHAIELGQWILKLEKYYGKSIDVEFAIDGITGELFCVQCRPETIHSNDDKNILVQYEFTQALPQPIASGIAVGDSIAFGRVHIITSMDNRIEGNEFKNGEILVSEITDPDYEPLMQKSAGIVCEKGGRTAHAAIIARELGKPAIVGVRGALETLRDGQLITIDCSQGDVGYIYDGHIQFERKEIVLDKLPKPPVSIMLNVGNPAQALQASRIPYCDGVSLAREEFILASYIKIHPMACLYPEKITDLVDQKEYKRLTAGFKNGEEYFIDKMTMGIAKIAAAFYPKPVILRTMDFKQEELKSLFCGKYFETTEERNGLIGFRGCSRYYSSEYKEAFGLECKAIKRARDELGLTNIIVMLPFCRKLEECDKVQEVMKEYGLERGVNGLQLYLMAEIPSNFILAEQFIQKCDGFSIGSNDITMLALGCDRDSEMVAHIYNEEDLAVKGLIEMAIKACKKHNKKIGICGQGPSDKIHFAKWLIDAGIDSLGLIPESVIKTILELDKLS